MFGDLMTRYDMPPMPTDVQAQHASYGGGGSEGGSPALAVYQQSRRSFSGGGDGESDSEHPFMIE